MLTSECMRHASKHACSSTQTRPPTEPNTNHHPRPPPAPPQDTAKRIKEQLTTLGHDKAAMPPPAQQKVRRLMQDFGAMLQDYKSTQKLAAEREATSLPRAQQQAAAAAAAAAGGGREEELERQGLLQQQAMEEARGLDNAMTYNEALIEERDHGIQQIQRQIGEVNEMFQVGRARRVCLRGGEGGSGFIGG